VKKSAESDKSGGTIGGMEAIQNPYEEDEAIASSAAQKVSREAMA